MNTWKMKRMAGTGDVFDEFVYARWKKGERRYKEGHGLMMT
jgi:hypothetical protein